MNPLKPMSSAATNPLTRHSASSHFFSSPLNNPTPSSSMLPNREVISASIPLASAAATAEDTATRQATFENGSNTVNNHVYTVHTGYPGACGTPR